MSVAFVFVVLCGLAALAYGVYAGRQVLAASAGSARMQEISGAIQEGAQAPRLTDAFLTTIYGAIASGKVMSGGVLDVPQVKSKLRDAASKVLGKDMVRDALIQVVNQRPM